MWRWSIFLFSEYQTNTHFLSFSGVTIWLRVLSVTPLLREDKEILVDIRKAVDSSMQLRSKKDLIENFIATINTATKVDDDWIKFVTEQKKIDLDTLIAEEKLKPDETRKFVDNSFRDGILKTTGTDVDRILPPVSRFGGGNRAAKKDGIIAKLQAFFDKYFGLI